MDNQIDIIALLGEFWQRRKFIIVVSLIGAVFGLIVGVLTPNKYVASSTFVPRVSGQKPLSSLGGLADLAGIDLNGGSLNSEIPPSLYPKILNSTPFLLDVLESRVELSDRSLTYKEYLETRKESIIVRVKKGIGSTINGVISWFKGSEDENIDNDLDSSWQLSNDDFELLEYLKEVIQIDINEKKVFVTLIVTESDRFVAAQIAKYVENSLQKRVIEYQIENAKILYDFTSQQLLTKKRQFYSLQDSLARFDDNNKDVSSFFIKNNRLRLASEYDLVGTIYKELATQKEQAALQIEKDTPIFLVIDPVMVPNRKSEPRRLFLIVVYFIFGLVISVSYILFKGSFIKIQNQIKNKN